MQSVPPKVTARSPLAGSDRDDRVGAPFRGRAQICEQPGLVRHSCRHRQHGEAGNGGGEAECGGAAGGAQKATTEENRCTVPVAVRNMGRQDTMGRECDGGRRGIVRRCHGRRRTTTVKKDRKRVGEAR